jgi:hypothetical protein
VTLFYIFRLENMGVVSRAAEKIRGENMMPDGPDSEPSYSFQPSVFGAARSFRLRNEVLIWEAGRRSGQVALARITRVRMSYRPGTLQTQRFLTEIWSPDTPKLTMLSVSWKSMVEQIDQGDAYRAFVVELNRRLAVAGNRAQFEAGLNPVIYWLGLALLVATTVALAGLIVRAFQSGSALAGLLIVAFVLLFFWQGGTIFYRNRPQPYRPGDLPSRLLPHTKP